MRNIDTFKIREALTYDDVLLVPQYSEVESRSSVDLSVSLKNKAGTIFNYNHAVIPANMKNITEYEMARLMLLTGGLGILHRFNSLEEQFNIWNSFSADGARSYHVGFSIGVKPEDKDNIRKIVDQGVQILCLDVAHGDSKLAVEMTNWVAKNYPNVLLISGNVATGSGAVRLAEAGADVVKVGIGPGSLCTTRVETGAGVPQLTAIMDVADRLYSSKTPFIADGGIKNAGDCVKALCFADMVMVGSMFAGTNEAPGDTVDINGKKYKQYAGSSTHKNSRVEGVVSMAPLKGPALNVLQKVKEGLQSGCSYQGVSNLRDLKESPSFVRITNAGLVESHPHSFSIKG